LEPRALAHVRADIVPAARGICGGALEAAAEVCAGEVIEPEDVLDLLAQLVDNSLVIMEEQGEATCYRLLGTIREYGAEKLQDSGEAAAVYGRHGEWYLALAEAAEPSLEGSEQRRWLAQLETEHDNLRTALDWA
jgi:predicted ATPase